MYIGKTAQGLYVLDQEMFMIFLALALGFVVFFALFLILMRGWWYSIGVRMRRRPVAIIVRGDRTVAITSRVVRRPGFWYVKGHGVFKVEPEHVYIHHGAPMAFLLENHIVALNPWVAEFIDRLRKAGVESYLDIMTIYEALVKGDKEKRAQAEAILAAAKPGISREELEKLVRGVREGLLVMKRIVKSKPKIALGNGKREVVEEHVMELPSDWDAQVLAGRSISFQDYMDYMARQYTESDLQSIISLEVQKYRKRAENAKFFFTILVGVGVLVLLVGLGYNFITAAHPTAPSLPAPPVPGG